MDYTSIITRLSDNGYEVTVDALKGALAIAATVRTPRHEGDTVAALRSVQQEFTDRVTYWVAHPHEDLEPCEVLQGGLYSCSWAAAELLYRIDHPEEALDSDRTEVPDLFLLGMCKANNELSIKVLETTAALEKATRAEALLKEYEELDKTLDAMNAPKLNVLGTRPLSVIERVEGLWEMLHEEK